MPSSTPMTAANTFALALPQIATPASNRVHRLDKREVQAADPVVAVASKGWLLQDMAPYQLYTPAGVSHAVVSPLSGGD